MCFKDFHDYATSKDLWRLKDEEFEDKFWQSKPTVLKYSVNNEASLFGDDVELWNLNKFNSTHSNIHTSKYYREVKIVYSLVIFLACFSKLKKKQSKVNSKKDTPNKN